MKPGAGDPFADDEPEEQEPDQEEQVVGDHTDREAAATSVDPEPEEQSRESDLDNELPYKYRRDTIEDDRSRANLFLRDVGEEAIASLVEEMDRSFESEEVYKIDVLEAAIQAAAENPEEVEKQLEGIGYGMK
ncbi:hypothetical protein [Halomicrobium salinisoli]|uniref:hypothetical protein n=1 Tax=Halomicrobium salinisoli TaxID=2878391 RepID=UPI001CF0564D|nr:hypothetical protein [Halomicrobium salinisoli]